MLLVVTAIYITVSLLTFIIYAKDKHASIKKNWRVPEKTLHLLSLLCGWPGAILAQVGFRHKTKKIRFQCLFVVTIILNCSTLYWLQTTEAGLIQ